MSQRRGLAGGRGNADPSMPRGRRSTEGLGGRRQTPNAKGGAAAKPTGNPVKGAKPVSGANPLNPVKEAKPG